MKKIQADTAAARPRSHSGIDQPCVRRPSTTVVLAMSADGKIADAMRSPARFGSATDKRHLEEQIARCDAVLFGAATLRAYGTTLPITSPDLLQQRQAQGQPAQPPQIVCSASGQLDPHLRFFQQPIPRWLLTTPTGAQAWQTGDFFDHILISGGSDVGFDWPEVFSQLATARIQHLAILGGGHLVASLLAEGCIDELCLTICPVLLGGQSAPTPVAGLGFPAAIAPQLELVAVNQVDQEVFLRYRVRRETFEPEPGPV
ncbi:MAG: RibD family protein [Leptolyngbyaceae cyanobacterium bins.349]|nr:RibD family protein [Leptolyngbyaceae cyanobacterium bins.349]